MRNIKQIIITSILCLGLSYPITAAQQRTTGTWDLVRQQMTKNSEPDKPVQKVETPAGERILHFPKDRSIGELRIQDEGTVGEIKSFFYWTEGDRDWESFVQAKGDVKVPAGKRVTLTVSKADISSLSALSKLNADDLYRLVISGSYPSEPTRRPTPDDRCLAYIKNLTGLKDLQLMNTAITAKGFSSLSNLKSLEYLTLSSITDETLAAISLLKSLKGLYIRENRLTNKGLSNLAGLALLEELDIVSSERLTDACLAHLAKLPSLKYLMLAGTNFTDAGMAYLKDITSLRILHVGGLANLTDAALEHIAEIPNLEAVSLHWSGNITDDGIAALAQSKSLKKLDIGSSKVTDTGLSYLLACKNLEYLTLPHQGISDTGLTYLSQLPNLRHLDVSRIHYVIPNMDVGYYNDKGVAELAKCTKLEELTIGSIGITDEGMSDIAKLTNLKQLNLFGCSNVTNNGISKLTTLKSLQYLNIYSANITIGGLSSLNELTNLTNLNLNDIHQDDAGLDISKLINLEDLSLYTKSKTVNRVTTYDKLRNSDLVCLSKLTKLKKLAFPAYGIDDGGLIHISGLKNLESVWIHCAGESSITDESLKYFNDMPKLYSLHITDGHFTDKGLDYLSGMPALNTLELTSDVVFSAKAVRNFKSKNPNIEQLQLKP
jgi:Leucine-rich repeat (LRR) protein